MKHNGKSSTLAQIEHDRLYPAVTNPNFLVLRSRRVVFETWISRISGNALKILDIGGRYQPYRRLFGDRVDRYIACDILHTELVNVVASGESLPFAPDSFDVVIATQVFEYFMEHNEDNNKMLVTGAFGRSHLSRFFKPGTTDLVVPAQK